MRALGVILIVVGIIALAWGGITYTKRERVLDMGSLHATVEKKEHISLSPVAGGVALVAGLILVARERRVA